MNLDFLSNVKVDPVTKAAPKTRTSVPSIPETADLRVFANGRVYPSKAFADEFKVEFEPKVNVAAEGDPITLEYVGNGLDIFPTTEWGMLASARDAGALESEFLCIAAVPKGTAKVDMWGSCTFDDQGAPKASVFTQGKNTFAAKRLVPMITAIYGINWDETVYVDLNVVRDKVIPSPNGIYIVPKIVSTGEKKGQSTYIRRENLTICPLVIADTKTKKVKEEPAKDPIGNVSPTDAKSADNVADVNAAGAQVSESTDKESPAADNEDWAAKLGQSQG